MKIRITAEWSSFFGRSGTLADPPPERDMNWPMPHALVVLDGDDARTPLMFGAEEFVVLS